jgi:hypothetical protein
MIKYLSKPGFYRFENVENKETEYSDGWTVDCHLQNHLIVRVVLNDTNLGSNHPTAMKPFRVEMLAFMLNVRSLDEVMVDDFGNVRTDLIQMTKTRLDFEEVAYFVEEVESLDTSHLHYGKKENK